MCGVAGMVKHVTPVLDKLDQLRFEGKLDTFKQPVSMSRRVETWRNEGKDKKAKENFLEIRRLAASTAKVEAAALRFMDVVNDGKGKCNKCTDHVRPDHVKRSGRPGCVRAFHNNILTLLMQGKAQATKTSAGHCSILCIG